MAYLIIYYISLMIVLTSLLFDNERQKGLGKERQERTALVQNGPDLLELQIQVDRS
jgi:hypothetical protein